MPTLSRSQRTDKSQQLRDKIDGSLDQLAKAIDEVRASEQFRQFLDVQARFHRYSWCNCMLIACQCPEATQVATIGRRSRMPACSSSFRRRESREDDISGTPRWRSLKRVLPHRSSRITSGVQRSAMISAARLTGQNCPYPLVLAVAEC